MYERGGWRFHAKGFWLTEGGGGERVWATTVGSSNFGARSEGLDFEAGCVLVVNPMFGGGGGGSGGLGKVLSEDWKGCLEYAREMEDRDGDGESWWVGLLAKATRRFL